MAHYSESGYCAEEMNRPAYYGEGGERYAVRKEYEEEIDGVERARRGHLGHGGGSHHHHHDAHGGHEEYLGGHREHGQGYGYGGRPYDACESKHYA